MTNSIDDFKAHLNQYTDAARSDRYRVRMNPPQGLLPGYQSISKDLSFQCEQAVLPGRTLATFDARSYGPTVRFPFQTTYQDLSLTFFCMANKIDTVQNGLLEKQFFDDWLELINPTPDTANKLLFSLEYKDKYKTDINVEHFDTHGNSTYAANYIDAFPMAMTDINLNWQDDSIVRLTIVFAYTRWQRAGASSSDILSPSELNDFFSI